MTGDVGDLLAAAAGVAVVVGFFVVLWLVAAWMDGRIERMERELQARIDRERERTQDDGK